MAQQSQPNRHGAGSFGAAGPDYARYRPGYPIALFEWLAAQAPAHDLAWDVGCGNGQASVPLAGVFRCVLASDLSARQIAQAPTHPAIDYRVAPAHDSSLPDASADLVCAAQAAHWFDLDRFYAEALRVLKPGGLLALWTYQLLRLQGEADALVQDFYQRELGAWWPPERRWVDEGYRTLPFPFDDLPAPDFCLEVAWTLGQFLGYLRTWNATRNLMQAENRDPTLPLGERLAPLWGEELHKVYWPIALRAGRKAA